MLTCYGHQVRLPQNDLAYVGFRLAALDTLCQMDACRDSGDDDISGYLVEVPVLEQVAPAVQVDLLAGAWRHHQTPELHEASLLDAAVVYAAFCTAGRVVNDEFDLARVWLKAGPPAPEPPTDRAHGRAVVRTVLRVLGRRGLPVAVRAAGSSAGARPPCP